MPFGSRWVIGATTWHVVRRRADIRQDTTIAHRTATHTLGHHPLPDPQLSAARTPAVPMARGVGKRCTLGHASTSVRRLRGLRRPRPRRHTEHESADGHHHLTLTMMNTVPASRYRDSPHTARGIPLSSNPTMTFPRFPRRQAGGFNCPVIRTAGGVVRRGGVRGSTHGIAAGPCHGLWLRPTPLVRGETGPRSLRPSLPESADSSKSLGYRGPNARPKSWSRPGAALSCQRRALPDLDALAFANGWIRSRVSSTTQPWVVQATGLRSASAISGFPRSVPGPERNRRQPRPRHA